jgi:rRNA-processing protein FCF1
MARNHKFKHIKSLKKKIVITDANVLIYVYWPNVDPDNQTLCTQYEMALFRLRKQGTTVVVTMHIITEAVNVVFTERWKDWNKKQKKLGLNPVYDYKTFRDSPEGIAMMDNVNKTVKTKLLKQINVVGDKQFNNSDAENFFVAGKIDYPDKLIAALAKEQNYIVFTHDGDFINTDVDLLTANGKILRAKR